MCLWLWAALPWSLLRGRYGNEFGRPAVDCGWGFLRVYERIAREHVGYCKPVMFVGGCGFIQAREVSKLPPRVGDLIVHLGGSGMRVGMGGSAVASGVMAGRDYESVQRANAEMQRKV